MKGTEKCECKKCLINNGSSEWEEGEHLVPMKTGVRRRERQKEERGRKKVMEKKTFTFAYKLS